MWKEQESASCGVPPDFLLPLWEYASLSLFTLQDGPLLFWNLRLRPTPGGKTPLVGKQTADFMPGSPLDFENP